MLWQDPHQTYHCFVTFLQIRVPLGWRADNKKAHQVFSAKIYWLSDDVGTRPARQWNPLPFKNRYATQATLVLFLFLFLGNIVVASDSFRVVVVCRLIVRQGLKLTREGGLVGWLLLRCQLASETKQLSHQFIKIGCQNLILQCLSIQTSMGMWFAVTATRHIWYITWSSYHVPCLQCGTVNMHRSTLWISLYYLTWTCFSSKLFFDTYIWYSFTVVKLSGGKPIHLLASNLKTLVTKT